MAGYAQYTAVLDACVLYPAPLRDLLLSLASEEVFCARWSERIQQEWTSNLLAKRPELAPDKIARTVALMNAAVEDSLVRNYEYLIESLALPDPDDRHVLAAAIAGHADGIVTFNLRDFPPDVASFHDLDVLHPDDFLMDRYSCDPIRFLSIVKACRQRLRHPPKSADELIATYELQGLPQLCAVLREARTLL